MPENNFRNAAKAFIVKDEKVLLLKRRPNDVHKPGAWDIPGGRLEPGENPFTGLLRETKEETNLDIEVVMPLDVHYFTRDDGQQITLLMFLCKPKSDRVELSEEHTEYKWVDLNNPKVDFPDWLHQPIENYKKFKQ
ncbi:MAG: NUDIX domain-containing protein [Candidatus Doudnabacteria bacterium]